MKIVGLVIWLLWCLMGLAEGLSPLVPPQLRDCYRGEARARLTAPRTLPVLLEMLRRLERHNTQYNMRMLTLATLYYLRLDGIEQSESGVETAQVLPYSATGHQFQRYRLLLDVFLPAGPALPQELDLPPEDKCLLHDMLSSTVDRWERGDEAAVCPLSMEQRSPTVAPSPGARGFSRCPVEQGVTQTPWGPVAMGTVLAAIAAALEPQDVLVSDAMRVVTSSTAPRAQGAASAQGATGGLELVELDAVEEVTSTPTTSPAEISNLWVATLAGDLAEVAVNQGPRSAGGAAVAVGTNSRWNDTRLPTQFYLAPTDGAAPSWHMTDAEILAGLDGLIIAQQLPSWLRQRPSLRLSQVLHMYYSGAGAGAGPGAGSSDDASVRACRRRELVRSGGVLGQLGPARAQLGGLARVLAAAQGAVYVSPQEMDAICDNTLAAFEKYLDGMLELYDAPCSSDVDTARAPLHLVVATGGAWKPYEVKRFLNWATVWAGVGGTEGGAGDGAGEGAGGTVTLLHGSTGAPIAPELASTPLLYLRAHSYTAPWPDRLNLPNVLTSLHDLVSARAEQEYTLGLSVGAPTVLVALSLGERLSAEEVRASRELVHTLRATYFDTYLVYVAQDLDSFYDLDTDNMDYSNIFVQVTSSQLEEVTSALSAEAAEGGLATRLLGPLCAGPNGTAAPAQAPAERYVAPGAAHHYRLHPNYLQGADAVSIELTSMGMGSVRACWGRGGAPGAGDTGAGGCLAVGAAPGATEAVVVPAPCPSPAPAFCPPLTLTVDVVSTLNNCANLACASPGAVGYSVTARGLTCARRYSAGAGPSTPRAALPAILSALLTARHFLSLRLSAE